jgi:hypothetical protein
MAFPVLVLAVLGCAVVAGRFLVTAGSALRQRVEAFIAAELAATRRQRGDLTGMEDARAGARESRRAAWRRAAMAAGWLLLLIGPLGTPWPGPIYAAYGTLWLVWRGAGALRGS